MPVANSGKVAGRGVAAPGPPKPKPSPSMKVTLHNRGSVHGSPIRYENAGARRFDPTVRDARALANFAGACDVTDAPSMGRRTCDGL